MRRMMTGMLLFLVLSWVLPAGVRALDPRYERNGECYLLIGDGLPGKRGVYRLNNPSGELSAAHYGGDKIAFDPGVTRGISVNLNRLVFTFAQHTDPTYTLDGSRMLTRRLKNVGDCVYYGAHAETRRAYPVNINVGFPTMHDSDGNVNGQAPGEVNRPIYTTWGPWGNGNGVDYGMGRDTSWGGQYNFRGRNAGWVANNGLTMVDGETVWSTTDPATGYGGWRYRCGVQTGGSWWGEYWHYWVPVDGAGNGRIPNNSWWQSTDRDIYNRPGNLYYWDRLWEQRTWYDLKDWDQARDGFGPTRVPGHVQPNIDYIADEYLVRYRISACINCYCINGGGGTMTPASPKFVNIAISPFGRVYQYSRTQTALDAALRLNGSNIAITGGNTRGTANDLSTKWVGISSKSASEDFIYFLGNKTFRDWIPALPVTFNASAVAVSDQWNLKGGIVFAYDASTGYAYQIFRSDESGQNSVDSYKVLNLGEGIDDLKADGFGNAYFTKTALTPADAAVGIGQAAQITMDGPYSYGKAPGTVYMDQTVTKTTYKRALGMSSDTVVGSVVLGKNRFYRRFMATSAVWSTLNLTTLAAAIADPGWTWSDAAPIPPAVRVQNPDAVQLAVINVGTPPRVENSLYKGNIDIYCTTMPKQTDLLANKLDQDVYTFAVENAPHWLGDNNINLPTNTAEWKWDISGNIDSSGVNGNTFQGGFVSSIVNTNTSGTRAYVSPEVLYDWRIYRIQDAQGNATRTLCLERTNYTRNRISYFYTPGVYEIHCGARYSWYDYDLLSFGSTIASRPSCLKGPIVATAPNNLAPFIAKRDTPPKELLGFVGPTDPLHTAVQIVRIKETPPRPRGTQAGIEQAAALYTFLPPKSATYNTLPISYFTATQSSGMYYRLNPSQISMVWDINALKNQLNDVNMVPGSLVWNTDAQFTWVYDVAMPDGSPGPSKTVTKTLANNIDPHVQLALDMPTDPTVGTISCNLMRGYEYYRNVYTYDPDTGQLILLDPILISDRLEYYGNARIMVTDIEAPQIVEANGNSTLPVPALLRGSTLATPTDSVSWPGYTHPTMIQFRVRDNNPFGNLNGIVSTIPESRHNRNTKLAGWLQFERGVAKSLFPTATGTTEGDWYWAPGVNVGAGVALADNDANSGKYHLTRRPQPYVPGTAYSDILYELTLNELVHLKDAPDVSSYSTVNTATQWPANFANNSPTNIYDAPGAVGANHPGFAFFGWARDSSGNPMSARRHLGNALIKDTLFPIPILKIRDYAGTFNEESIPFNVASITSEYQRISNFPTWAVNAAGIFVNEGQIIKAYSPSTVPYRDELRGIPWGLAAEFGNAYHPPKIQEGMELFLAASATDNIGILMNGNTSDEPRFTIEGPIASTFYHEGGATQILNSDTGPRSLRMMMRYPGLYHVTMTAKDTALEHDRVTKVNNTRTIKFGILVSPVRMNIRLLEKKNDRF